MKLPWRKPAAKPRVAYVPHRSAATLFSLYVEVDGVPMSFGAGQDIYAQGDKLVVTFTKGGRLGRLGKADVFFSGHYLDSVSVDVAGGSSFTTVELPLSFSPTHSGVIAPK